VATVNERLSVHNVTFHGAPFADLEEHWAALGVSRLSILDSQLLDPEFPMLLQRNNYSVEAVYHLSRPARWLATRRSRRTHCAR
jgi:hypothetical protein